MFYFNEEGNIAWAQEIPEGAKTLNRQSLIANKKFAERVLGHGLEVYSQAGVKLSEVPYEYANGAEKQAIDSQVVRFGPNKGLSLKEVNSKKPSA